MGHRSGENLNVTCPCCKAKLTVDPVFGAVLSHEDKEDILAKKFEEAMKKAKDAPASKPIRDFDLD